MNYVYMLRCGDETLYTGWTNNLSRRLRAHNNGVGGKYTRARLPVRLVYYEVYADERDARRREYAVKRLPRHKKERLIASLLTREKDACEKKEADFVLL